MRCIQTRLACGPDTLDIVTLQSLTQTGRPASWSAHGQNPTAPASLLTLPVVLCADLNNCYFADPAVDVLGNLATDNVTGLAEFDSEQHRKIRLYLELAAGNDANGHGTHTMGTLCGNCPSSAGTYATDYRS